MGFVSVLSLAHQLVQQRVRAGELVVDATAGNGNDTLFLARLVGPTGTVAAFDIQREALDSTRRKLEEAGIAVTDSGKGVRLVLDTHAELRHYIEGAASAVMFNLGYLPGADQSVITTVSSTLAALDASLSVLRPGGVLTAVVYPGHPGGREEAEAVEFWAAALPQQEAQAVVYRFANRQHPSPPYLIAVEKQRPSAIIDR